MIRREEIDWTLENFTKVLDGIVGLTKEMRETAIGLFKRHSSNGIYPWIKFLNEEETMRVYGLHEKYLWLVFVRKDDGYRVGRYTVSYDGVAYGAYEEDWEGGK